MLSLHHLRKTELCEVDQCVLKSGMVVLKENCTLDFQVCETPTTFWIRASDRSLQEHKVPRGTEGLTCNMYLWKWWVHVHIYTQECELMQYLWIHFHLENLLHCLQLCHCRRKSSQDVFPSGYSNTLWNISLNVSFNANILDIQYGHKRTNNYVRGGGRIGILEPYIT